MILSLAFVLSSMQAQDVTTQHSIDIKLDACLASDKGYSGYGLKQCLSNASAEWDDELNKNYKRLMNMAVLTAEQKQQLKSAQRAWIKYRDEDISYLASTLDSKATIYTVALTHRQIALTKQRALTLAQYYQDFNH